MFSDYGDVFTYHGYSNPSHDEIKNQGENMKYRGSKTTFNIQVIMHLYKV